MYKIEIYTVGKHKEEWLAAEIVSLEKRLYGSMQFVWKFFKKEEEMEETLLIGPPFTLLDEKGLLMPSATFSQHLMQNLRSRFVIGGANGVSKKIHASAEMVLSFSPMTFTHQHIRLLLMEQIYRAFTIAKGTPYHK